MWCASAIRRAIEVGPTAVAPPPGRTDGEGAGFDHALFRCHARIRARIVRSSRRQHGRHGLELVERRCLAHVAKMQDQIHTFEDAEHSVRKRALAVAVAVG